jgi:hypothetical protein
VINEENIVAYLYGKEGCFTGMYCEWYEMTEERYNGW